MKKKIMMMSLLAVFISCPVFADSNTDINNQKSAIQTKYENDMNSENQAYKQGISEAKQHYQNDPNKLGNVLKELEIKHDKKMDELNSNKDMGLQKLKEHKNSV